MEKLNIWLLQIGEPLPIYGIERKMRTALLAERLLEHGHRIHWWASAFEHQRKKWIAPKDKIFELSSKYSIRVIRGLGYKKNVSLSRYLDHILVAKNFKSHLKDIDAPDAIIASMPCYHLAYEAMRYARQKHIPFIVDIRDLWPDIFINQLRKYGLQKIGRLAFSRDFAKLSRLLSHADGIVAISQGCLDWALSKIERSQNKWDRVFYHGYHSNKLFSDNINSNLIPECNNKKIFIFLGTFGESYELDLVIEVAKRFNDIQNKDIVFYIAGTGEQYDRLKRKAAHLTNVYLPGWLDADQIHNLLQSAWAGIVPCKSVENAAPNKVFEYLSASLPLISSLEGEIADLIKQYQVGLNYRTGDADGLYQCINILATNAQLRNSMSEAAGFVFKKYGDADRIYDDYADYIEKIVENYNKVD